MQLQETETENDEGALNRRRQGGERRRVGSGVEGSHGVLVAFAFPPRGDHLPKSCTIFKKSNLI